MLIRRMLHGLGYRYTLHRRDLPGAPDLVFPSRKKVILVHGCFWHQHKGCIDGRLPKSREDYWLPKLLHNVERDRRNIRKLRRSGWKVMKVWECEVASDQSLIVSVCGIRGRFGPPSIATESESPERLTSTVRGAPRYSPL